MVTIIHMRNIHNAVSKGQSYTSYVNYRKSHKGNRRDASTGEKVKEIYQQALPQRRTINSSHFSYIFFTH